MATRSWVKPDHSLALQMSNQNIGSRVTPKTGQVPHETTKDPAVSQKMNRDPTVSQKMSRAQKHWIQGGGCPELVRLFCVEAYPHYKPGSQVQCFQSLTGTEVTTKKAGIRKDRWRPIRKRERLERRLLQDNGENGQHGLSSPWTVMNHHSLAELHCIASTAPGLQRACWWDSKRQKRSSSLVLITRGRWLPGSSGGCSAGVPLGRGRPTGSPSAYLILDLDMSDSVKAPASPEVQSILEARA